MAKRIKLSRTSKIITGIFIFLIIYFLILLASSIHNYFKLRGEINNLLKVNNELVLKNKALNLSYKKARTLEHIEKVARNKLNLVKKKESLIVISNNNNANNKNKE